MILGRITGSVVSTIHHPIVEGHKLLLAERLDENGKATGVTNCCLPSGWTRTAKPPAATSSPSTPSVPVRARLC
jgi:hypothetical protein